MKENTIGIKIVASLMILFGLAEICTGISHSFFGLVTSEGETATYIGIALGASYFIGGLCLLPNRKSFAVIAIVLLIFDITGRISMVITGLYPVNTLYQITGIVIGTGIAVFFAIYVGRKLKSFK